MFECYGVVIVEIVDFGDGIVVCQQGVGYGMVDKFGGFCDQ